MSCGESEMKSVCVGKAVFPDVSRNTNIPVMNINLLGQGDQAEGFDDEKENFYYE